MLSISVSEENRLVFKKYIATMATMADVKSYPPALARECVPEMER